MALVLSSMLLSFVMLVWFCCVCSGASPEDLEHCINNQGPQATTMYEHFVEAKPARMRLRKVWWSGKPRNIDMTVVTGLTVSRLSQLEAQCRSWKGPLSAAAYFVIQESPDNHDGTLSDASKHALSAAAEELAAFHHRMELEDNCQLDLMLAYEVVGDPLMQTLLPINALRNYALLQARTNVVAMVDVDLLLSKGLSDDLAIPSRMTKIREGCRHHNVYVLPAFETKYNPNTTWAYQLAETAVRGTKAKLKPLVDQDQVFQFAGKLFQKGHKPTNYTKWFSTSEDYQVQYEVSFEPWFMVDRFLNPFYDSRFRGYGWNKVTQVANVDNEGFKFIVHSQGFIVHRQHDRSKAGDLYFEGKKQKASLRNLHDVVGKFRTRVNEQMKKRTYRPLVDSGVMDCRGVLPWWKSGSSQMSPITKEA